jgi:hypothetical protein
MNSSVFSEHGVSNQYQCKIQARLKSMQSPLVIFARLVATIPLSKMNGNGGVSGIVAIGDRHNDVQPRRVVTIAY